MNSAPVMIMAGGTGGHIFPGLAVAQILRERNRAVVWLGTRSGLEARLVPEHGIEIDWISVQGLRGKGVAAWVVAPILAVRAIWQVLSVLRRHRPAVVLGLGGFVSGPGGIAAWLSRKPLIIHEQNAIAGTANRLLVRFARRVYSAFPGAFPDSVEHLVIGNPVRPEIAAVAAPAARFAQRRDGEPRLLVVGGSQGAKVLNERIPAAVAEMSLRPQILHQAGRGLHAALDAYRAAAVDARVEEFLDDMAAAYAWADLVVARAGALTIAELEGAGVGAILVPYPYAVDDHQLRNAELFCANGAGIILTEKDLTTRRLATVLERLLARREAMLDMAVAARAQAKPGAAAALAEACLEYCAVPQ